MAEDNTTQEEASGYALTAEDAVAVCTQKGARLVEFTETATEEKPIGTVTIETDNLKKITFHASDVKGATQAQARSALAGRIARASK